MGFARIATMFVVALMSAGGAVAQDRAAPAERAPADQAQLDKAPADKQALPLKPDPSKLKRPLPKRRSVQQRIDGMPTPAPIVTDGYRPSLTPRGPAIVVQPVPVLPAPSPPMPSTINRCDGGGCLDTSGARYTGGVGNTVLDQNGRNCVRTGTTVQCF